MNLPTTRWNSNTVVVHCASLEKTLPIGPIAKLLFPIAATGCVAHTSKDTKDSLEVEMPPFARSRAEDNNAPSHPSGASGENGTIVDFDIADVTASLPKPPTTGATLRFTNVSKGLTSMPGINSIPEGFTRVTFDTTSMSTITTIKNWFLSDCSSITSVDLSGLSGVTSIGEFFLFGCANLKKLDLTPISGVTIVGDCFFLGCSVLTSLDLSPLRGVISVGNCFLRQCSGLTSIDLSPLSGVTSVGSCFLSSCCGLASIDLHPLNTVTCIGHCFLYRCSGLTSLDLSPLSGAPTLAATSCADALG